MPRKKWSVDEIDYIISQWNDIEGTGARMKSDICREIARRMSNWGQRRTDVIRTNDQIRRQIEKLLGDQDPRIPTVC